MSEKIDNLKELRKPFKSNQIGRLPKPTARQTSEVKNDFKNGDFIVEVYSKITGALIGEINNNNTRMLATKDE